METLNGIAPASSCSEALMPDDDLDFGFTWPKPGHGLKFGMKAVRSTYASMSPPAGIFVRSLQPCLLSPVTGSQPTDCHGGELISVELNSANAEGSPFGPWAGAVCST